MVINFNPPPQPIQSTAIPDDSDDDGTTDLSPDTLMAYCETRLDSINSQVTAMFADQQRNASEIKQIDAVTNLLKNYSSTDQTDPKAITDMETHVHDLIASLSSSDPNCAALPKIIQAYNNMLNSGTGPTPTLGYWDEADYPPDTSISQTDMKLGSTEIQMYAQNLTDAAGTLDSNSELQMIQLQSLMSQRSTAISLTTNLVQSFGDEESKIAENIGH